VFAEGHDGLVSPPLKLAVWRDVLGAVGLGAQLSQARHIMRQLAVPPYLRQTTQQGTQFELRLRRLLLMHCHAAAWGAVVCQL
jgi:hypothetical protein